MTKTEMLSKLEDPGPLEEAIVTQALASQKSLEQLKNEAIARGAVKQTAIYRTLLGEKRKSPPMKVPKPVED